MAPSTIADFELTRNPHPIPWTDPDSKFLDTVLPLAENSRNENWTHLVIDGPPGSQLLFEYSVSAVLQTLLVRTAFLRDEDTGERYTDMPANQLIADCWRAAVDEGQHLRYLAFKQVTESSSLAAMEEERDRQVGEGMVGAMEFERGEAISFTEASSPYWRDNVWLRCSGRVAQELSDDDEQRAVVSKAYIMHDRLNSEMDLIVELTELPAQGSESGTRRRREHL